jgi:small nuclear ribonucleoprotein (snRNP)-like protein
VKLRMAVIVASVVTVTTEDGVRELRGVLESEDKAEKESVA